jgi:hypothetical protein
MGVGSKKTKDSGWKPIWRPYFSGGPRAYSLLKPRHFENQAIEHDNRYIDM